MQDDKELLESLDWRWMYEELEDAVEKVKYLDSQRSTLKEAQGILDKAQGRILGYYAVHFHSRGQRKPSYVVRRE